MENLLIPYLSEGFELDWTKTVPVNEKDIAMYLNPRIAIVFTCIWDPETRSQFEIGHFMESHKDIDCDDFSVRYETFRRFRDARVVRNFEGKRSSIFFDEEEAEILATVFKYTKFTAIVSVYVDGKNVPIKDLPPNIFKVVNPLFKYWQVSYLLPASEYRKYANTKRVKVKKIKKGGVNVKKVIAKMFLGAVGACAGIVATVIGVKVIGDSYDDLVGNAEDVIMEEEEYGAEE